MLAAAPWVVVLATAPEIAGEIDRLAGQRVTVAADGQSYVIDDVAGEGAPIVGVVERRGEVRLPVEVHIVFADGSTKEEVWDGRDRWKRFEHEKKVVRASVDGGRKIALDVDPANNYWVEDKGEARRAAAKWSARFLFWLQNLLELHTVLG